ncbi:MAG: DUF4870 domain-containing protein [Cyclobacteriaceae bacterium]
MEYHEIEQPNDLTKKEKEDAMGAYLMMFASVGAGLPLPIINLIASIVYFIINKGKSRFVKFHSYQSLLSQFPTTVINAVGVFWAVQIFLLDNYEVTDIFKGYVLMAVVLNLVYFIFSIVGAVKARKGLMYYFIFFGKLSYHYAYAKSPTSEVAKVIQNVPPKL